MRPLKAISIASLFIASALVALPATQAQIHSCSNADLNIIFLNPDLNERAQVGRVTANGAFFAQFQVIGDRADEVDNIGFSFGVDTIPFDESVCNDQGYYYSGQQVQNYRADTDPSDGFFINLQTTLVPDGEYTAAVHAYDASDNELARFWVTAAVDNCEGVSQVPGGLIERCPDDANVDTVQPWPIILPGDGVGPSSGFTLEFAEELSALQVLVNGLDVTDELQDWQGRLWDDDLLPGYGPFGLASQIPLVQECSTPAHTCSYLGEAYQWGGSSLEEGDVINVIATDMFGNRAIKSVHLGSGNTGGAITADFPIIDWQVDEISKETTSGSNAIFRFTLTNQGGSTGHPFADPDQVVPEGWDYEWNPPHLAVPSGESTQQEFVLKPPAEEVEGLFTLTARMTYAGENGEERTLEQPLTVVLTEGGAGIQNEDEGPDEEEGKGTPAPGAIVALLVAGLAAVLRRRS